jgi:hypothetical protein
MAYEVGTTPVYQGDGGLSAVTAVNTPTVTYPTGINEDDLLIVGFGIRNYITPTRPSPWVDWGTTQSGNIRSVRWAKRATGSETGSLGPLTHGSANPICGVMVRISGVKWDDADSDPEYEDFGVDNWATSTTNNIPAIETYNLGRLCFAFLFNATAQTLSDDGSEWGEQFDYNTTLGSDFSIGGYTISGPAKGIVSADSVTISASSYNHTWACAVVPPLYDGISARMKFNGIEIGEDDDQVGSYMGVNIGDIRKIGNSNGTQD